jgi:hypothetical protein
VFPVLTPISRTVLQRELHHIVETGVALLAHSSVPLQFWDDTFVSACYLINQLPSKALGSLTPFEKLFHSKPSYSHLKVFGSVCWPSLRPYNPTKLAFRSMPCVFLGYSSMHNGYKCFHIPTSQVYMSRDVVFDETVFPFAFKDGSPQESLTEQVLPTLAPSTIHNHDQHDVRTALISLPAVTNPLPNSASDVACRSLVQEDGSLVATDHQLHVPMPDGPQSLADSLAQPSVPAPVESQPSSSHADIMPQHQGSVAATVLDLA